MATIGIDTGGTFTDLVRLEKDGTTRVHKCPSTPDDPGRAVLAALEASGGAGDGDLVVHGTTVALNALLTGRTARTALVTNAGFGDLIEIGRQTRPDLYALEPRRPDPLVPRALRFEVRQRSFPARDAASDAAPLVEIVRPTDDDLARLVARLERARPEAIAVCLLHAYDDPEIERRVARALAPLGVPVTCSSDLVREHREFERFATAVVNAALVPAVRAYLTRLRDRVAPAQLTVLQSSGGHLPADTAGAEPVRVITSGPAGGVVGARAAAREAGHAAVVALDMGGTSTDVAFARADADDGGGSDADAGGDAVFDLPEIGGHPIAVPSLDLVTIGCGGGSLVRVDAAGALHVGPGSAGADPGPVAYGRSDALTVTDAHAALGHLAAEVGAERFAGGAIELDLAAVDRAFADLARSLGTEPRRAARAVLAAARASMRRAIAAMTHERGHDPARLPLVAFGGAGGLHAAALADSLDMPCALVPRHPGALSALGMTRAGARREAARTLLEPLAHANAARRRAVFAELADEVRAAIARDPGAGRVRVARFVELRYLGQVYRLRLPEGRGLEAAFHAAHARLYGHRLERDAGGIEVVCLRAVASRSAPGGARLATDAVRARPAPARARLGRTTAELDPRRATRVRADVWDREALAPGHGFDGPAIVREYSGTTLVPVGWRARVVRGGHLELRRA